MEDILIYFIFLATVVISVIKPEISLTILLNIYIFRAIPYVNFQNPSYNYRNENDILLGAILPFLCFVIIIIKTFIGKKKIRYKIDVFDFFMFSLSVLMVFSFIFSPDISKSITYFGIFIILGLPFYFVTKLHFMNANSMKNSFYNFIYSIVFFALIFSVLSIYLNEIAKYPHQRLTLPGVHPIPFCLFLTLSVIFIFIYYIKPEFKTNFSGKKKLLFSLPVLAFIIFTLIKTNTRGPVFSMILSFLIVAFIFFKIKINMRIILSTVLTIVGGVLVFLIFFDVDKVAGRFVTLYSEKSDSFSPRLVSYLDSLNVLLTKPWGISVGTFRLYTKDIVGGQEASYPHNLFMELISSFGLLGLALTALIIVFLIYEYNFIVKNQKEIFENPVFFSTIIVFLFFFIETQFSFTLNTHKGWYFSMALYSVFRWDFIKNKSQQNGF